MAKRAFFPVCLLSILICSCSEDGVVPIRPDCAGGDCNACKDECDEGAWACTEAGYHTCVKGKDGCLSWGEVTCQDGKVCDATKKECVSEADVTDPIEPTDPTDPKTPSEPTDPTEPTDPKTPSDPTEPTDPKTPSDPTEPTDPTDPKDPTEPTDPIEKTCDGSCAIHAKKCEGSLIVSCEENEDGCGVWSSPRSCGADMYCDESSQECVVGCADVCTEGASMCDGAMVKHCERSGTSTCFSWSTPESCGVNMHCDGAQGKCVDSCVDECTAGETMCDGAMIRVCGQYDSDDCLEYSESQDCGTDLICMGGECAMAGCPTDCSVGTTKCNAAETNVMKCTMGNFGCPEWVLSKSCGVNEKCEVSSSEGACVPNFETVCNVGVKTCMDDGRGVQTCVANDHGNEWSVSQCGTNMACDASTKTCVDSRTCRDACTENARECSGNQPQVCKKGSNGCTSWVKETACSSAQTCQAGSCVSNCGGNCDAFSIIILPDTQNYVRDKTTADITNGTTIYHDQMRWIVANQNTELVPNLKMVVHMGDITNYNTDFQWKVAKSAHEILREAKVPFTVVNGNHDYRSPEISKRSNSKFETYFPESYLKGLPGYGGIFEKHNSWFKFTGGSQEYMVLNLEYAPRQQAICWANDLLREAAHANQKVIIATHANLTHGGEFGGKPNRSYIPLGASGQEMWDGLTSRHSNIIMVLNGHIGDSEHVGMKGNQGNMVEQILTDYQFELPCSASSLSGCTANCKHDVAGGNGWLRILTFYPNENRVVAKTVSVLTGDKGTFSQKGTDQFFCSNRYSASPSTADHQFELKFDFTSAKKNTYNAGGHLGFVHREINATENGDQLKSRVAAKSDGSFVTVWEDNSSGEDGNQYGSTLPAYDIYARILNTNACDISGKKEIIVNAGRTAGHQAEPDVAMDSKGNFVVVWTDDHDNNGTLQVYMRGFNADGSERFGIKTVNSESKRDQYEPRIAMAPDGQFAVSWTDTKSSASTPQIMVRGFKADGTENFADRPITDTEGGTQVKSDIFMDSSHNVVVVWQDDSDGNGTTQTKMRILKADGTSKISAKTVNGTASGNQDEPAVSGKTDGSQFIVTWTNIASKSASAYTIMGATFDASGTKVKSDFTLSKTTGKNQTPDVCMNEKGNVAAVWYNPTNKDVMRRVMIGGSLGASDMLVNSPSNAVSSDDDETKPQGHSYQPSIACIPGSDFEVTTFTDNIGGNAYYDILGVGQKIAN